MKLLIFMLFFISNFANAAETFSLKANLRIFVCTKENGYINCKNIPGKEEIINIELEESPGGTSPNGMASISTEIDGHLFTSTIIVVKDKADYMVNAVLKKGISWQGLGNVIVENSQKLNIISWYGADLIEGKMVYSPVITIGSPNVNFENKIKLNDGLIFSSPNGSSSQPR